MEPGSLSTRIQIDEMGRAVVHATGDIDIATSPSLHEALARALEETPAVVVDLGAVGFIDSSGLSALVWGYREAQQRGGALTIQRPSQMARRLLDITGLGTLLRIEGDPAPRNQES